MAVLFGLFAIVALLLASIGLYAVIAHIVSQRTQEIGIRIAIGASARDILRLVYVQGLARVGIGLTIGVCSSLAINRVLSSVLVQVSPTDPLTLVVSSVTLLIFGTLGCWLPARRALRVDPLLALRHQ
jgi:ABC-type antimicrobial peptide transport system permease subunit